ncbi:MAG TPA: hypothetical protein VL181_07450, partial [Holophagaceae bacterium]|nr:hypothetical protein [Holophagaceae bacterium]
EHELEHRDTTMEQYLSEVGQTQEEFEAAVRTEIEAELKRELVLDEIAQRANLPVSNEEIEEYYLRMAEAVQQPVEQLVEQLDVNAVRASILQRKAVDWLYENSALARRVAAEFPARSDDAETEPADESANATQPAAGAESEATEAAADAEAVAGAPA